MDLRQRAVRIHFPSNIGDMLGRCIRTFASSFPRRFVAKDIVLDRSLPISQAE